MGRLTDKHHNAINKCSEYSSCYSCHKENCYIKEIEEKLGELEDVLEKYGIDNLDDFIKEYSSRNIKLANDNYDLEQELAELRQKAIVPKFERQSHIYGFAYGRIKHYVVIAYLDNTITLCEDVQSNTFEFCNNAYLVETKEEAEQKLAEIKGEKDA